MITHAHFLLVFKFKSNFTDKSLINNVINQLIGQFYFESRPDNTPINPSLESKSI